MVFIMNWMGGGIRVSLGIVISMGEGLRGLGMGMCLLGPLLAGLRSAGGSIC